MWYWIFFCIFGSSADFLSIPFPLLEHVPSHIFYYCMMMVTSHPCNCVVCIFETTTDELSSKSMALQCVLNSFLICSIFNSLSFCLIILNIKYAMMRWHALCGNFHIILFDMLLFHHLLQLASIEEQGCGRSPPRVLNSLTGKFWVTFCKTIYLYSEAFT